MKTNIINERESDKTLGDAIAKGALLWAPLCTLAVSSVFAFTAAGPVKFTEILFKSMLLFSPLCIGAEVIVWELKTKTLLKRIGYKKEPPPKLPHFVPPGARTPRI